MYNRYQVDEGILVLFLHKYFTYFRVNAKNEHKVPM
jgi:hypothetical protein